MEDFKFQRVSTAELQRRWNLLRKLAGDAGLDALIALGNEDDISGTVRWFTDDPVSAYRSVIVFCPRDGMILIEHGGAGDHRRIAEDDVDYRGISEVFNVATFQSAHFTLGYEAEIVVKLCKARGFRRIGLVGAGNMPHRFVQMLHDGLAGQVGFSDQTDALDALMAVKSAEEQVLIRTGAALQDEVFSAVLETVRPGIRDVDIAAAARAAASKGGGTGGVILVGSAPQGDFAPFRVPCRQNRVIEKGDYISVLIENAGPGGYFTEMARTVVVGKAGNALRDLCDQTKALQSQVLSSLQPGKGCGAVFAEHNKHRVAMGHAGENRIFAHGQGYNLVERPLVRNDEPMLLQSGMTLAVHPTLADGQSYFAVMCDNFILGESGPGPRLHRTEQRIFEV